MTGKWVGWIKFENGGVGNIGGFIMNGTKISQFSDLLSALLTFIVFSKNKILQNMICI